MLTITNEKAVSGGVVPSVYLEDEFYSQLKKSKELRIAILESMGTQVLVVDRLGNSKDGVYLKEPPVVYSKDNFPDREVGLYLEL